MQLRNIILGCVIAACGSLLPVGQAQALPAGWHGGCAGSDYVAWDGNGNWIIFYDSSRCQA
jgi:hypothetical protein